ncbi:MAG: GAF domain-containing protein [Deltaproteobacteria bacterium]|nr:GAF domain-containing protein [Deltaproteobacteria bacterium]
MAEDRRYDEALSRLREMLGGDLDPVAAMATVSSVLRQVLPHLYWVGFYRVTGPGVLEVGPYQGTPGCLRIDFGKGVVGTCAARGEPRLVRDVRDEPNHVACDPLSRCEVVVPVREQGGGLVAVLDADCTEVGGLDHEDVKGLQAVADLVGRAFSVSPCSDPL